MVKPSAFNGPRHRNIVEWLFLKCLFFSYHQPHIFKPRPIQARRHAHGEAPSIGKTRMWFRPYNIGELLYWMIYKDLSYLLRQPPFFFKPRSVTKKPRVLRARKRPMLWCRRPRFLKPSGNILQPGILLPRVRIPDEKDNIEFRLQIWNLDPAYPNHYAFPKPRAPVLGDLGQHPYIVLIRTTRQQLERDCKCPVARSSVLPKSKVEVRCSCDGWFNRPDGADYLGENEKKRPFRLKDEVRVQKRKREESP